MMAILLNNLLSFIIILSIVVFVHEFGHYIVAIMNDVKVDEFSIGFGKELYGWNDKKGTRWKICIIPMGGFVKFFGDEDETSSVVNKNKLIKLSDEDKKKCLYFKTVWQRIQVVAAGPLSNYLLAIVFFTIFYMCTGIIHSSNLITGIVTDSPAYRADILAGDRIIEINGDETNSFEEIKLNIAMNANNTLTVKIDRNGEILIKNLVPEMKEEYKNVKIPVIGILSNDFTVEKSGIFKSFVRSIKDVSLITTGTLKGLGQMIIGRRSLDDMGGPVKIAQYSGKAMKSGFLSMIYFIALISTSLGLMNLLPIPALDGGHLLFYIIEVIRRKPLTERFENILVRTGFSILISLMILITIKDIFGVF
jgi:regulator of sigma E protease